MLQHNQLAGRGRTVQDQRHGPLGRGRPVQDLGVLHPEIESIARDIDQRVLDLLRAEVLQKLDGHEGVAEALRYLEVIAIRRHDS